MATTISEAELAIILKAKAQVDQAFGQLDTQLKKTETQIKLTGKQMDSLHAEALRMNAQFQTSTKRAGGFADAIGKTSTTLARSASMFGLNADALRALDDAADVAELGFKNLTTSAAGFNTASVGIVGAGLAIGFAIGGMLNKFEAVRNAADAALKATKSFFGIKTPEAAHGFGAEDRASLAAGAAAAAAKVAAIGKQTAALKEQNKHAVENARVAKQASEAWVKGMEAARKASDDFNKKLLEGTAEAALDIQATLSARSHEREIAFAEKMKETLQDQEDAYTAMVDAQIADGARLEEQRQLEEDRRQETIRSIHSLADAFAESGDLLVALGVSGTSVFVKLADGFSSVANAAGKFMQAMATGSLFDKIGAGIGLATAGVSMFKKLFFGGQDEHKQVNDIRDAYVAAAGGITELDRRAQSAGLSVAALLKADTVKEYEAAIRQLATAFDTQAEAQRLTNEAIDRYGFSIEELGPKFAQQRLDEQFQTLFQDYQLLNAAGVDHNAIIARMGPSLNEYVNSAIKAGGTIPEAMRPVVEELIATGQLLDENGVAFESVEDAGITFAQTLEEGIGKLIDKITQLVNAMLGIPTDINVNTNFTTTGTPPGAFEGGGGGGGGRGFQHGGAVTQWGVPAMLHGTQSNPEFVLRKDHLEEIAGMMAKNGGSQPAGGQPIHVHIHTMSGQEISHHVTKAARDGHIRIHPDAVTKAGA
jgi:hypothetical protein